MTIASELQNLQTNLQAAKTAVTTKGGTVGDTGLAGLASEIASIPSGGGNSDKCVKFFDYNGDLVASYTVAEANALAELPPAPTHADLEFVEWTETLAHVNGATGPMYIGATYQDAQSHGNDTTVTYHPISDNPSVSFRFQQDVENGVTVDWGDGSTPETFSGTGNITASHTYTYSVSSGGTSVPYLIRLSPASGTTLTLGHGSNNAPFSSGAAGTRIKIVLGRCNLNNYWSYSSTSWSEIIISKNIGSLTGTSLLDAQNISYASMVSCVVIPKNFPIGSGVNIRSRTLETVIVPSDLTNYYLNLMGYINKQMPVLEGCIGLTLSNSGALTEIEIPNTNTHFYGCSESYALRKITIPAGVTSISGSSFSNCYSLKEIVFKDRDSLTFIPNNLFNSSTRYISIETIDLTDFTQIPAVNSYFFAGLPFYTKILVPSSLAATWKTTSGWSARSSQIVGV